MGRGRRGNRRERVATVVAKWKVFRGRLTMEMVVVRPMMRVVVANGKRERTKRNFGWKNRGGWFLAKFGLDFLHPHAVKSTPIYRSCKRIILSTQWINFSPWFGWEGFQSLVQIGTMNCQMWQFKAAWGGYFRPVCGAAMLSVGLNEPYPVVEGVSVDHFSLGFVPSTKNQGR